MEDRKATKVNIRHHAYINTAKQSHLETYYTDTYEVGKEHVVPDGEPWEVDKVTEIRVVSTWNPHVEVEFEEWGEIWLNDYVVNIYFEHERYQEIRSLKKSAREAKRSGVQPTGSFKDLI